MSSPRWRCGWRLASLSRCHRLRYPAYALMGRSSNPPWPRLGGAFLFATRSPAPTPQIRATTARARQLHSRMCSTIAAATMSRSTSVRGRSFFPTFQPSANHTSLRNSSATVGAQSMWSLENKEGTYVKGGKNRADRPLLAGHVSCIEFTRSGSNIGYATDGEQEMATSPSAAERQAAIESMKAWQEARDTHVPGSKEYSTLHEEYLKALAVYHNHGK
jgi:hypothetical protein